MLAAGGVSKHPDLAVYPEMFGRKYLRAEAYVAADPYMSRPVCIGMRWLKALRILVVKSCDLIALREIILIITEKEGLR